jgi:hypothetical protein
MNGSNEVLRISVRKLARPASRLGLMLLAFATFGTMCPSAGVSATTVPVMTASAELRPEAQPRTKRLPATLRLGFTSAATETSATPELAKIAIEVSRRVSFQWAGLPSCPLATLRSGYGNALQACAGSLVGHGRVVSEVTLPGREPAVITGHLLAFYALAQGKPRILAQVTSGEPLPLSYVIPFAIEKLPSGSFGTKLLAPNMPHLQGICAPKHPHCFDFPYTLQGVYGHISELQMSLHRVFSLSGERRSFVKSLCPAPGRQRSSSGPLAKVDLSYTSDPELSTTVNGKCIVAVSRPSAGRATG